MSSQADNSHQPPSPPAQQSTSTIGMALVVIMGLCGLGGLGSLSYLIGQDWHLSLIPTATPLPPPVVTIAAIQAKAELTTIEYNTVTEIYVENPPEGFIDSVLGTNETLLMLVYGEVRAGFDLEDLTEEHLWTDGTTAKLVLPAPKLLNSSIDFERTHIVYYKNSLLLDQRNPNLQGEAFDQAKQALEQAALENQILERANAQGELYFENLLFSLGFTEVEVVVDAQIFRK